MLLMLGVAVGLVLGLTGAGGSILAVPLLMAGAALSVPQAAPVALLAVMAAAGLGAARAWRKSYVRYRAASLMAVASLLTAPLGLLAASRLPLATVSLMFAAVLALAGLRLLLQARRAPVEASVLRAGVAGDGAPAHGPLCRLNAGTGRIVWTPLSLTAIALVGLVTGFLAGLLGVGGGFVIVPALRALTPLSMHSAVATSLMAIALTSAATVGMHALHSGSYPLALALPFAAGAVAGMLGAQKLAPRIAGASLQQGFALLMLLVAAAMAAKNLGL